MGRPAYPHCKAPNCTADRYVWPNGARAVYCRAHLRLRNTKQRDGLPSMTGDMRRILLDLRQCKEAGWPYVRLNPTHYNGRSIAALMARDWVFVSAGADGERVGITGRGLEALEVYLPVRARHDGICPRCNVQPRGVRPNGRIMAYCLACEREYHRIKGARLRRQPGFTDRLCTRCHERPRYRHIGGLGSGYCLECDRERAKRRNARQRRQAAERARAGEIKPCVRCGLRPRKAFANSVSHYCEVCSPVVHRMWKLNRMLRARGMK